MQMKEWEKLNPDQFWNEDSISSEIWKRAAITIHSHWLSEEEAEQHWMSVSSINPDNSDQWDEFLLKEKAFIDLFIKLENDNGFHLWKMNENEILNHEAQPDMETLCKRNVREEQFDLFKSDSLEIVIAGNYDLTFPVYQPRNVSWSSLSKIIGSVGLYLLT